MKKILFIVIYVLLFQVQARDIRATEELKISKDNLVMIRDYDAKSDYFFFIDNISYIEKNTKTASTKYNIVLNNSKTITIYNLNNYRKLLRTFIGINSQKNNNTPLVNNEPKIKPNNTDTNIKNTQTQTLNTQTEHNLDKKPINQKKPEISFENIDIIDID